MKSTMALQPQGDRVIQYSLTVKYITNTHHERCRISAELDMDRLCIASTMCTINDCDSAKHFTTIKQLLFNYSRPNIWLIFKEKHIIQSDIIIIFRSKISNSKKKNKNKKNRKYKDLR